MRRPPATLVLPLLRQDPAFLEVALRSALDQGVPGEVIVVTSPQTPAPELAVLAAAATGPGGDRLRIVERPRPGFAVALNAGIAAAASDRVGFLMTDDWLDPTALEASLAHDADIVTGGKTIWDATGTERLPMPGLRTREVYDRLTTDRERAAHVTHFLLFRRVDMALSNLGNIGEVRDVGAVLESQADSDASSVDSSYTVIRSLIWTIPILGFIGTVVGLSQAIGSFTSVLNDAGGDSGSIKSKLGPVVAGLATAFETTLVALLAAVVIQLLSTWVFKREEALLDGITDFTNEHVLSRLKLTDWR